MVCDLFVSTTFPANFQQALLSDEQRQTRLCCRSRPRLEFAPSGAGVWQLIAATRQLLTGCASHDSSSPQIEQFCESCMAAIWVHAESTHLHPVISSHPPWPPQQTVSTTFAAQARWAALRLLVTPSYIYLPLHIISQTRFVIAWRAEHSAFQTLVCVSLSLSRQLRRYHTALGRETIVDYSFPWLLIPLAALAAVGGDVVESTHAPPPPHTHGYDFLVPILHDL